VPERRPLEPAADERERRAILGARLATVQPDRFGPICQPTEALHALSISSVRTLDVIMIRSLLIGTPSPPRSA